MLPLLRIRSECSFKRCYGKIPHLAKVIQEMKAPVAALVDDDGTWGHTRWYKSLKDTETTPALGCTLTLKDEETGRRPQCWFLALPEHTRSFYTLSSANPSTIDELLKPYEENKHKIIMFAGEALLHYPDLYDYVDINPSNVLVAISRLEAAEKYGKKVVLTPYNNYPEEKDLENFLVWDDSKSMRLRHIDVSKEAFDFLTEEEYERFAETTREVGKRLKGLTLPTAPIISVEGDIKALSEEGKKYRLERGHIKSWTNEYEERLQKELRIIEAKKYQSYFIMVADLVLWAKRHMLVGPARGSAAGSLVCYLLQITEVDPIPFDLIFERFIDLNREDLPDIDIDFSDKKREMVWEYLDEKYGTKNCARIGSLQSLKARSVMAHATKKLGINPGATFPVLNGLIEYSSGDARYGKGLEDTLENTAAGREFVVNHPEFRIATELENHASHTGVHAAGIIVCNEPVTDFCTVRDGVAQLDKKDAEFLNLLKIDALGLRTLGVIEDAGVITQQELYDMKFDDPEVLGVFNEQKFSGIFQFEGAAQRSVAVGIKVDNFVKIDHITALARPGPLGGGAAAHYVARAAGSEKVEYHHPSMIAYTEDTFGVVLYQEQVMRMTREIGKFSWADTSAIRRIMSKSMGQEFFDSYGKKFIEGAATDGIPEVEAKSIWNEICSFGSWGMNKSHTTSYAVISYWCAYLKKYHPLEYAAATLRNAKDDEQVIELLRELRDEGVEYISFDAELSDITWAARDGKLIGGFDNLVGIGRIKARKLIDQRKAGKLTTKDVENLTQKHKPKIDNLAPAYTRWKNIYDNPESFNIRTEVKRFGDLEDGENAVIIAQLIKKERRDENESVRVARRGGKEFVGQSLFLDMFMVDDSVAKPVRVRVGRRDWCKFGIPIADKAINKEDWFLIRGRWLGNFNMMNVIKIKCLTNGDIV